jgi:maleate cis-trans isomerase
MRIMTDGIEYSDEEREKMRIQAILDDRMKHIPEPAKMRYSIEYTREELAEAEKKASEFTRQLANASARCVLYGFGVVKIQGGDK